MGSEDDEDHIFFSSAEGYAFVQTGISETDLFRLEELPFVRKILSAKDPVTGLRIGMVITDSDLTEIRRQLNQMVSAIISPGMEVSVIRGELAGLQGEVLDRDNETVDIYVALRSIKMVSRLPRADVRPLGARR